MSDARIIAAQIDTSTVAGHNLRALLLRLADGDDWRGCVTAADSAEYRHLICNFFSREPVELTPLGRDVAELLRPEAYRVCDTTGPRMKRERCSVWLGAKVLARNCTRADAARIAALLTDDDLVDAKTYNRGTDP